MDKALLKQLEAKYLALGEDPNTYLKGLLYSKPTNYWDYIEVDTLLSLQKPKTEFEDETVFIIYHQITELTLKLMIHEVKQMTQMATFDSEKVFLEKLKRLSRYTDMLITSFEVMTEGLDHDDYNKFRMSLAPASGFQSAQFRYLELMCTPTLNLVNDDGLKRLSEKPSVDEIFENIYWRDAGYNRETGKISRTLKAFEDKYLDSFKALSTATQGKTVWEQFQKIEHPSENLKFRMKEFDHQYNIKWQEKHLNAAKKYLEKKGNTETGTGGSAWKKYLNPKHQQRSFFPDLWKDENILDWV